MCFFTTPGPRGSTFSPPLPLGSDATGWINPTESGGLGGFLGGERGKAIHRMPRLCPQSYPQAQKCCIFALDMADLGVLWWFVWANSCATLIAVFTCFAMWRSARKNHRHPSLSERLLSVETDHIELRDKVIALDKAARRAYGRESVQRRRDRQANGGLPDPQTHPDEWKREMMRRRTLGDQ